MERERERERARERETETDRFMSSALACCESGASGRQQTPIYLSISIYTFSVLYYITLYTYIRGEDCGDLLAVAAAAADGADENARAEHECDHAPQDPQHHPPIYIYIYRHFK